MLKQEVWIVCKYCESEAVVRFGKYREEQLYWCRSCRRKFKAGDNAFQMKTPAHQVSAALDMYYEGLGIEAIRRQMQKEHGVCPYFATVYGWIKKYTQYALESIRDYRALVGDRWVVYETAFDMYGKAVRFLGVIDPGTQYLLASRLSTDRTVNDVRLLMEDAVRNAGKTPKAVVADKLKPYLDGLEFGCGGDAERGCGVLFNIENDGALVKSVCNTIKERNGLIRGHRHIESAVEFNKGWTAHYNYFKPHGALHGGTPAAAARIAYPYKSWDAIVREYTPLVTGASIEGLN